MWAGSRPGCIAFHLYGRAGCERVRRWCMSRRACPPSLRELTWLARRLAEGQRPIRAMQASSGLFRETGYGSHARQQRILPRRGDDFADEPRTGCSRNVEPLPQEERCVQVLLSATISRSCAQSAERRFIARHLYRDMKASRPLTRSRRSGSARRRLRQSAAQRKLAAANARSAKA